MSCNLKAFFLNFFLILFEISPKGSAILLHSSHPTSPKALLSAVEVFNVTM